MKKFVRMIGFFSIMLCLSSMVYSTPGDIVSSLHYAQHTGSESKILDISLAGATNQSAVAVALQSTGKNIVASYYNPSSLTKINLQRFTTDFSLDTSFGTDGVLANISIGVSSDDMPEAIAIDADNRIIVAGEQNETSYFVACAKADGSGLDSSFGTNGITTFTIDGDAVVRVSSCAVATDGKILVAGLYGSSIKSFVARFTSDGVLDTSFNESTIGAADGSGYVTFDPDGNLFSIRGIAVTGVDNDIILVGDHWLDSSYHLYITKLLGVNDGVSAVAGSLDTTFGSSGVTEGLPAGSNHHNVRGVAVDGSGRIIVGGSYGAAIRSCFLACYSSSGDFETSFHESSLGALDGGCFNFSAGEYSNEIVSLGLDSDGNILCGGVIVDTDFYADNFVARITPQGQLDTTFNSTGISIFSFAGHNVESINSIAVQGDGAVLAVGYDYSADSKAYIAPVSSAGVVESTTSVVVDSYGILGDVPADNYSYTHEYIDAAKNVFVAIDVAGTDAILAKVDSSGALEDSFNTTGYIDFSHKTITAVIADAAGHVYVCGTDHDSSNGWLKRYNANGSLDTGFGTAGTISNADLTHAAGLIIPYTDLVVVRLQQSLQAYYFDGTPAWTFTKTNYAIDDFVADPTGNIFIVARQTSGGSALTINKINGHTGVELSFAGDVDDIKGVHDLSSSTYNNARIALDYNHNVVVALQKANGTAIDVKRYAYNASSQTQDAGVSFTAVTNCTLSRLQGVQSNKIIFGACNSDGYIVVRLKSSDLSLDDTFNSTGYKTFTIDASETSRVLADVSIDSAGDIVAIGYANISTDIQSFMTRILGDTNSAQVARFSQAALTTGLVNTSFATHGLVDLSGTTSGNAKIVRTQSSGKYIVVVDDGTNTTIIRLTSTGAVDTSLQLAGKVAPADLVMLADDSFLLAGGTSTSWVVKINSDLTLHSDFGTSGYVATNITKGLKVAQQANGRWLLAGTSGSTGVLQAYSAYGVADATFATAGVYSTGVTSSIVDVVIDAKDRIVFGYLNSGTLVLSRLNSNGKTVDIGYTTAGAVDFQFGTTGVVTTELASIASDDDVRVVLGSTGAIYAVAYTGGKLEIRRYDTNGAQDAKQSITPKKPITLKNVRPLSDGSLLIVGYESETNALALVRVGSDVSIVESLLEIVIGDLDQFNDAQVISSGNITLAAYDQDATSPYLVQLVDTLSSLTDVSQSVSVSSVGTVDQNFVYNSIHDGTQSALPLNNLITSAGHYYLATEKTLLSSSPNVYSSYYDVAPSFTPELVYYDATNKYTWIAGTAYTTGGSAVETRIIRVNADGKKVNFASGTNGVVTLSSTHPVAMLVAQDGYMYIAGSDWVSKVNITSGATSSFYNVSSGNSDDYQPISNVTITGLAQQSHGRILLVGSSSNYPYIAAYSSDGLYQDPTFIYSSALSSVNGTAIGACVASDDSIFLGYVDSGTVKIAKFLPDGSGLATSFASSGIKTTDISSVNSSSDAKMLVDASGNMVVVAATNTKKYKAAAYNQSGTRIGSVYSSAEDVTTESHLLSASLVLTNSKDAHALELRVAYVGYDNQGSTNNKMVVGQLGANDTFQNEISVLGSQTQRKATDVVCLPDGMLWFVGYEYVSTTYTPYVARVQSSVYAANTTTMQTKDARAIGYNDMTFDLTTLSGFTTSDTPVYMKMFASSVDSDFYHTYNNSYTKYGTYFVGFNGASSSYIAKIIGDHKLDTAYSSDGLATSLPAGLLHFTYDYQGRTLLAGYNSTNKGWLYRLNSSQSADSGFNSTGLLTEVFGSATDATVNQVAMQSMGRIIVAGTDGTQGYLRAIDEQGLVDTVWATQGNYAPKDVSTIPAVAVASNDTVYCAYEEKDGSCTIAKLREEGTLDTSFSSDGLADDIFNSTAIVASTLKIAVDPNRAVIFAASVSSGSQRYAAVGKYSASGTRSWLTLNFDFGTTGVTVADLCLLENGKFVVVGYTSTDTYILYCNSSGTLANAISLTGLTASSAAGVNYDGRLVIVGQDGDGKPTIARVQLAQYNQQADAGDVLNPARIGSVDAIWSGSTQNNGIAFFGSGSSASNRQYASSLAFDRNNDIYTTVNSNGTNLATTYLVKFLQDGTLQSSNSIFSSSYDQLVVTDMMIYQDQDSNQQKALMVGYVYSTTLSVYKSVLMQYIIDLSGLDSSFGGRYQDNAGMAFGDMAQAYGVKTTGQGRIMVIGKNATGNGIVAAYNRNGFLDTSWATAGLYTLSNTTGLYTHLVDSSNRVVAAYKNGSSVDVIRILADGSALDTSFSGDGVISGALSSVVSNTDIKLAVNASGNVFVAARQASSLAIAKFAANGTSVATGTILYSPDLGGFTSFTLVSMVVTEDGKIVIAGYDDASSDTLVIARIKADLSGLDTEFNTTGYIKYCVTSGVSNSALTKMLVHPDGRIIVVGYEA